jgi:hypothetical protein
MTHLDPEVTMMMSIHALSSLPDNVSESANKSFQSASGKIRQKIASLTSGQPFATADFLDCGSRANVDQTLRRMKSEGQIIRVVRGIYMKQKPGGEMLSSIDVARAKAKAFYRELLMPNGVHAIDVNASGDLEITYLVTGSSSSFQYGNVRIRFKGVTPGRAARICRSNENEWPNLRILAKLNSSAPASGIAEEIA